MSNNNRSTKYFEGMKVRRKVLGDKHVDRAIKNTNQIDKNFQEFITEGAWGTVWSSDKLKKRDRSLITIAHLAALGHDEELEMHFKASKRWIVRKTTRKEIKSTN